MKKINDTSVSKSSIQAAWNFFRLGLLNDAELEANQYLQQKPKSADALHLLGAISLHHGRTKVAVELISKAIQIDHKNPEFFNNLGLAYHEQGLIAEAIKQYQRAIILAPDYANAHYNLHAAVLDAENPEPAMTSLKKVLDLNPRDVDAIFMLGLLNEYVGNTQQADLYLERAKQAGKLYQARYDAWQYIKSASKHLMPMMGSAINTFKYAMRHAASEGLVLEFGVRFGNSIHMLADLADLDGQAVHGFDSFEGLPDEWHHEPKGSYTTKGVIPEVPGNVTLHAGWFDQTLPAFLAQHSGSVRFINVDCDIYSSTKTVLALLAPRIVAGTVIVFDEYIGNAHWREDEFKA